MLRLPAAHWIEVGRDGARRRRYWRPRIDRGGMRSDADYEARYRELLVDSVRRLSRAAGPLAFEVSGGRHPVVEQAVRSSGEGGPFIENDCLLGGVVPCGSGPIDDLTMGSAQGSAPAFAVSQFSSMIFASIAR